MTATDARPRPLAAALSEVRAPGNFNPSTFGGLLRCPLSIIHGLPESELLPPNPRAILGTLIHEVMHRVRLSKFESEGEIAEELMADLDDILRETESQLSADSCTRSLVPLRRSVGRTAWKSRLALLRAWATGAALGGPGVGRVSRPTVLASLHHERVSSASAAIVTTHIREGSEVSLSVPALRLCGRVDSIARDADGTVQVLDLKSGAADEREESIEGHVLQLRLYASMLEHVEPGVRLQLWVEGAERVQVPWNDESRAATLAALEKMATRLPPHAALDAADLAREGPHCSLCRARHRCPRYREVAPAWWRNVSTSHRVAPFDLWGTVLKVRISEARLAEVELRDAADRRARVSGLERWLAVEDVRPGEGLWFFDLEPSETLPHHGAYTHPLNFHGSALSRNWRDALRLRVYVGSTAKLGRRPGDSLEGCQK